jgi:ABC-type transporter Mla subunit MlaD
VAVQPTEAIDGIFDANPFTVKLNDQLGQVIGLTTELTQIMGKVQDRVAALELHVENLEHRTQKNNRNLQELIIRMAALERIDGGVVRVTEGN